MSKEKGWRTAHGGYGIGEAAGIDGQRSHQDKCLRLPSMLAGGASPGHRCLPSRRGRVGKLESVFDEVELGKLAGDEKDFEDIKAELYFWVGQQAEPGEGATLDEALFVGIDGIRRAAKGAAGTGLDFHKGKHIAMARDNVDFSLVRAAVVAIQDAAALGAEVLKGNEFSDAADFTA